MDKDWFPFFSMLFWFFTKLTGLGMAIIGLTSLASMVAIGFAFWHFVLAVLAPTALGGFLLVTDTVHDVATAEMRRKKRQK